MPQPRSRPSSSRKTVSRDEIAAAALAYLDQHGLERLSMRRLAADLGVGTMTLYGHFASKSELLDAVIDRAVAHQEPPSLEGSWSERLHTLALASRDLLSRHPGLVQIRALQPVLRPQALRTGEVALEILEEAGFPPQEAAQAFRLLFTYVFGFAAFSPEAARDRAREAAEQALSALPPDYYPALTAAMDEAAAAMAGDAVFDYGLQRILDGLAVRLAALQPS